MSKEVITPLDRKTGKPIKNRGPIFLESVPLGACGELILLYTPFSQARFDETKHREIIAWDLKLLAYGIKAMLTSMVWAKPVAVWIGRKVTL